MGNILIIKTGAAGDVVRTTCLLNVLEGDIYWVTAERNKPLLSDDKNGLFVLSIEEAFPALRNMAFDHVISLEEDIECARLASQINTNELTGVYFDKGGINYTGSSACWFDMSRISSYGLPKANQLKAGNTESYQSHIFKMLGKKFNGQPYRIFRDASIQVKNKLIGIEKRTGKQWPDKKWWGYDKLIRRLESEGHVVRVFKQRTDVREYLRDIAGCDHIISGDTLAMHIALAYEKTCTAIFNCTSPPEIYDYGLLKKVVSPLLKKYFYASSVDHEVIESVSLEDVYKTLPF